MRRPVGIALLLVAACPPAAAAAPDGFPYSRALEVERPGWVRVPLDAHAQGYGPRMVRDPEGKEVGFVELRRPRGEVEARIEGVRQGAEGWELAFDLGPVPFEHEALKIELDKRVAATGCVLEGSPDGDTWSRLARADLFRIGEGAGLGRWDLEYAPTGARYLRLHWPARAGFPELRRAVVKAVAQPSKRLVTPVEVSPWSETLDGARAWRLELPAPGLDLRELRLEGRGSSPLGYRLYGAHDGVWQVLAAGELPSLDDASVELPSVPEAARPWAGPAVLRLELFPGGGPVPELRAAAVALEPRWILFEAREAGRYHLLCGEQPYGSRRSEVETPRVRDVSGPVLEVVPGPVEREALPALAPRLTEPRVVPRGTVVDSWRLESDAPPGTVARLEIPGAVASLLAGHEAGERILAHGREVPFVRWTSPEPALVLERANLAPRTTGRAGSSEVRIDLPEGYLPAGELELLTDPGPLDRPVVVHVNGTSRPGVPARDVEYRGHWTCDGGRRLPCRYAVALDGMTEAREIRVVLEDRDNPPLGAVDARLWGRREFLLFAWPGVPGEVRLARLYDAGRPRYEIEGFREALVTRPWREARLDAESFRNEQAGRRWRQQLLLILALVAAGGVLVWVLVRVLRA